MKIVRRSKLFYLGGWGNWFCFSQRGVFCRLLLRHFVLQTAIGVLLICNPAGGFIDYGGHIFL